MAASPTIAGIPLKYISLATLTLQNSLLTILLRYSRTSPTAKPYSAPAAVLLNELLKGSISLSIAIRNSFRTPLVLMDVSTPSAQRPFSSSRSPPSATSSSSPFLNRYTDEKLKSSSPGSGLGISGQSWGMVSSEREWYMCAEGWRREFGGRVFFIARSILSRDCWKLSIPAILYVIQNNLQFIAASNLDVATFQVTYQLKILTTALCSVVMLKRRLTKTKWWSLFGLAVGVALVQLQNTAASAQSSTVVGNPTTGFIAVTAACVTSGLAGVYFELVLKGSNVDLWIRNVQLSLFSLLPALGAAFLPEFSLFSTSSPESIVVVERAALFANFGVWAWATVLTQVVGGLVTALVIKFADNILKGFATSLSIVISFAAGIILFNFELTSGFAMGCSIVLGATYAYNQPERILTTPNHSGLGKSTWFSAANGSSTNSRRPLHHDGSGSPLPMTSKDAYFDEDEANQSNSSANLHRQTYLNDSGLRKPFESMTPQTIYRGIASCTTVVPSLNHSSQQLNGGMSSSTSLDKMNTNVVLSTTNNSSDGSPRHRLGGRSPTSLTEFSSNLTSSFNEKGDVAVKI